MKKFTTCILDNVKKIRIAQIIYSALFALMLVFSRHVIRFDADRSSLENAYFTDIHLIDIALWLLITIMLYAVFIQLPRIKKESFFTDVNKEGNSVSRKQSIIQLCISFAVIIICYLPYAFSYWPGGIYSDTMNSIAIALKQEPMTTHEPIAYTLLWKLMFALGGGSLEPGDYGAMNLLTILQIVGFAAMFSSFINWNYRRGLKKAPVVAMTLIFAVFPLFPYYAISLWKDTVFGIVIFLFSWHLFCMQERIDKMDENTPKKTFIKDLVLFILLSVLCVFCRNNGIYVLIIVSASFVLTNLKNKKVFNKLLIATLATVASCLIIQHPVFNAAGFNVDTAVESMAIPIEQTAYIVSTDGKLSEKDITILDQVMPLPMWKEIYSPVNVDYFKFDGNFDRDYFNNNAGEFFKTYIHVCLTNPVKAVKGYLLATIGFWDIFEETGNAYICPESIAWTGVFQGDFFTYKTGVSFRELVEPRHYISAAIWVWIMLFSIFFAKGKKNKLAIVPALSVWATIMLAVPLAFSFRYVFAVFLCMPIYWLCLVYNE